MNISNIHDDIVTSMVGRLGHGIDDEMFNDMVKEMSIENASYIHTQTSSKLYMTMNRIKDPINSKIQNRNNENTV